MLLISFIIAVIALIIFISIILTDNKSTFDWVVLLISGLTFHASGIYFAITWIGLLQ